MKKRWRIRDIIDLEYFAAASLLPADGNLRQWLEQCKILEKEKPEAILPGDFFDEIHRLMRYLFVIAGIMTGAGLAFSLLTYRGTEPLNISVYIGLVVGTQLIILFFLLFISVARLFGTSHKSVLYSFLGSLTVRAIMTVRNSTMRKLSAIHRASFESAIGIVKGRKNVYGSLFFWPLFMLTQLFGIGFNIGVMGATLIRVIGADIAFGWQSTVQMSAVIVYRIVTVIAIPWSWFVPFNIAHPSLAQIEGSRLVLKDGIRYLATHDLISWWPFLCFTVLFYGLMPRLILLFFAVIRQNQILKHLTPRPPSLKGNGEKYPIRFVEESGIGVVILIPDDIYELCDDTLDRLIMQSFCNDKILQKIRIGTDESDDLKKIAGIGEASMLILQEAWQPPIREILIFLEKIRKIIGKKRSIRVALIGRPKPDTIFTAVREEDFRIWLHKINTLADPYLTVERLISPIDGGVRGVNE